MQSLDRRLTFLEAAIAKERQLGHLTDAELDDRIADLLAQWQRTTRSMPAAGSTLANNELGSTNSEKQHAQP
jgi:hypothetical protein